jgi:hypothetical protein
MCLQVETMPSAYITVNKGRKKIKGDKYVYLNNGQEFEIELFNPTSDNLLTKIWINNKLMSSSGIVLRPGERVFLERYIDVPKKFLFDTYEVNGDSSAVQKAIEKNGLIKVQFFREDTSVDNITLNDGRGITWTNPGWRFDTYTTPIGNNNTYTFNTTGLSNVDINGTLTTNSSDNTLSFSSVNSIGGSELKASFSTPNPMKKLKRSKKTETGRVEQGSHSEQTFEYTNKKFHSYAFRTVEYQIKPTSTMVQDVRTLVSKYCTGCGKKAKPAHKFCSSCGTKL